MSLSEKITATDNIYYLRPTSYAVSEFNNFYNFKIKQFCLNAYYFEEYIINIYMYYFFTLFIT